MKKTAFLQALVIVILLLVSWAILYQRSSRDPEPARETVTAGAAKSPEGTEQPQPVQEGLPENEPISPAIGEVQRPENIPPLWAEWIAYLQQQTPPDLPAALEAMRNAVFSMPRDEATARVIELMLSGVNIRTGSRFVIGEGGVLRSAPDLQTLLADWLGELDPGQAARIGKMALIRSGIQMGPDLYVVHLRNYLRGSADSPVEVAAFVRSKFAQLVQQPQWRTQPTSSVAEAFDFAVWLQDAALIPALADYLSTGTDPGLAHAASLAIQRIVDASPQQAGTVLADTAGWPGLLPELRAANMARLDPSDPGQQSVLASYLLDSSVTPDEVRTFFQYFPNLNRTLSHNLVSPEISITGIDIEERLNSARTAIGDWLEDPAWEQWHGLLEETDDRIRQQLGANPAP